MSPPLCLISIFSFLHSYLSIFSAILHPFRMCSACYISDDPNISMDADDELEIEQSEEAVSDGLRFFPWLQQSEVGKELISLGKITCPTIITSLLLYSKTVVSMLFLGHLGELELAAGTLAIGFANITGFSVLKGFAMGMQPICAQAYGAKRWPILSETYSRATCLLFTVVIPILILWLNMYEILVWLGQDRNITSVAKIYILYSIPELLAQAHFHPLRIFLRSQGIIVPITISATCAMILHIPINYFLVVYLDMGVKGVALASACNTINTSLGLLIYLKLSEIAIKPWENIKIGIFFQGWKPLLELAVPSVVSVCLEWWWYEIMIVLCGLLSNPQANVAAMGILMQVAGILYGFPHSLSLGLSTLIGHELGAEQPSRAQKISTIGLIVAFVFGLLAFSFTIVVRNVWGSFYTSEPQTLGLTSIALPILGLCELGNCTQTAACGILTGSARPQLGAWINLGSFYLIGLPIAVLTAFKFQMGIVGFWCGLVVAQFSCACMMVFALVFTDWNQQTIRAKNLVQDEESPKNDLETSKLIS